MIFAFNKEKALVHRWSGTSELVETLRTFFSMLMLVETLRTFFSTLMLACGNTSIFLLNFDAEHLPWAFCQKGRVTYENAVKKPGRLQGGSCKNVQEGK